MAYKAWYWIHIYDYKNYLWTEHFKASIRDTVDVKIEFSSQNPINSFARNGAHMN